MREKIDRLLKKMRWNIDYVFTEHWDILTPGEQKYFADWLQYEEADEIPEDLLYQYYDNLCRLHSLLTPGFLIKLENRLEI